MPYCYGGMENGLFFLVILGGLIIFLLWLFRRGGGGSSWLMNDSGRALDVLDERYVKGEISKNEYLEKKKDLKS